MNAFAGLASDDPPESAQGRGFKSRPRYQQDGISKARRIRPVAGMTTCCCSRPTTRGRAISRPADGVPLSQPALSWQTQFIQSVARGCSGGQVARSRLSSPPSSRRRTSATQPGTVDDPVQPERRGVSEAEPAGHGKPHGMDLAVGQSSSRVSSSARSADRWLSPRFLGGRPRFLGAAPDRLIRRARFQHGHPRSAGTAP